MYTLSVAVAALLATAAVAAPIEAREAGTCLKVTPEGIQAIAPASASCATTGGECRTAAQAAPAIQSALKTYGVTTRGEAAAVIATMAFESGDFKYQRNAFPGRPGQGTRNMQMIDFNIKYAKSIPALAQSVAALPATSAAMTDAQKNQVVNMLVANDAYDFGSAVWFLTTQCGPAVRTGLAAGTAAGFEQYVTGCIGTTNTPERLAYYQRALANIK